LWRQGAASSTDRLFIAAILLPVRMHAQEAKVMQRTTVTVLALAAVCSIAGPMAAQPIDMDGRDVEWPADAAAVADGGAVYFRLHLNEVTSIQSAPWQISLLIDVDGDPKSGNTNLPGADGMGVDLEFRMSPFDRDRLGLQAFQHPGEGAPALALPAGAHQFFWAPTHASDTFEFRMMGLPPHESVRARFVALDIDGDVAWATDTFGIQRSGAPSEPPAMPSLTKPEGAVRVMSMNVRWGTPFMRPDSIARIIHAINPDVILLQEWEDESRDAPPETSASIDQWFAEDAAWEPWHAVKGSERGVAVVSRYPLERIDTDALRPSAEEDPQVDDTRGIRVALARVKSPMGDLLAASVHLKCCGSFGGSEDAQRVAEAQAINGAIRSAMRSSRTSGAVVGGDFNLVGAPTPLAALSDGADLDGSTLESADLVNIGTRRRVTWQGGDGRFPPGRLDYVLYSGAGLAVAQSFVLDPAALDEAALASMGLEEGDLTASDHLPIVVDFVRGAAGGTP
jgi:endonuclease/exonuclease/phosphatase family metal-dependent hydrolase